MEGKKLYFDYSPCTPFSEGDPKQAGDDCEQDLVNYVTNGRNTGSTSTKKILKKHQ